MKRHGWFEIPGVQSGDRKAAEQLRGLEPALAACKGKTVLDLGCAEGMIAAAFAKAGASRVVGIELLQDHCDAAARVCAGLPVEIICAELKSYIERTPNPEKFDIVLALGIAHKLHDPGSLLDFAARSCKELLVFRGPGKVNLGKGTSLWDGWLQAKFGHGRCHVPTLFKEQGFQEGETLDSAHGERSQYWRRA